MRENWFSRLKRMSSRVIFPAFNHFESNGNETLSLLPSHVNLGLSLAEPPVHYSSLTSETRFLFVSFFVAWWFHSELTSVLV